MSPELSLDERMMAAVDKLEDTSPNVRTAAVNALENLGGHLSDAQDQTLVMALNAKLASTEPYVRFAAMRAMSVLDPGVLVDHAYVFGDILARGRFVPMELLGAAMRAKEVVTNHAAVERFVPMLRSVNAEERRQAVTDLGDLGLRLSKRQAQAVVALLGDPKWWVQAAAVKTLAKLPQPHLYAKDVVPMLTARENGVRDAAVAMLKNLPRAELEKHEMNLKAMASSTAGHVRDAAIDVLQAHGIKPPLPLFLVVPMLRVREKGVRDAAVAMLKDLPSAALEEHILNLKAMAFSTAEHMRDAAGDVLRAHGIEPMLKAREAVDMLRARENGVRDAAVAMLKNLPPAELEEHEENLKAMASNTAEHVRDAAGDVLRAHGIEPPLPSSLSTPTEIRHAPTATASSPHTHHAPGRPRGSAPPPSPVQFHPPPPER